jgi:penicillin-binding protein 1A
MRPRGAQGALVSLDRDGAVRALVGGRNYANSIYNRATQATRQPGSSFKLFVYLTALESGYRPDTVVEDGPIRVGNWSPRNDNGRYVGPVPLRAAFAYSINTVAVRLGPGVGTRSSPTWRSGLGVTSPHQHQTCRWRSARRRCGLIDLDPRPLPAVGARGVAVTPYWQSARA